MSHFSVAVIHHPDQSVDDLLAPYSENLEVEPYIRYTKSDAIKHAREYWCSGTESNDEIWKMIVDEYGEDMIDEDSNVLSTYNPDSKWDWYAEGGRFCGMLHVGGEECNSARIKDVDFSPDKRKYDRSLRFWDVVVGHQPPKPDEEHWPIYNEKYYLDYYKDRETYARRMSGFGTYAVVTPDGEWHGKGDMGWWGMSSENSDEAADWDDNYLKRFILTADPEDMITIMDCHI